MSLDYSYEAKILSRGRLNHIIDFYDKWTGSFDINFKFRFLKSFVLNLDTNTTQWILLHRWANKRNISNQNLPGVMRNLIDNNRIPIRVFHSVSEWLAPHEIDRRQFCWILNSSILPIETDISFEESLQTAKLITKIIEGERFHVFSGNKSIHIWWMGFNFEDYLKEAEKSKIKSAQSREQYDRLARKRIIKELQSKVTAELDDRNAIDTKRVVPVIGSMNGFTGKLVVRLDNNRFQELTMEQILKLATI